MPNESGTADLAVALPSEISPATTGIQILARKSWIAYARAVLIGLVVCAIPLAIGGMIGNIILVLLLGLFTLGILNLRSFLLYCDDAGIWCRSGVLPWTRGLVGVKWRDLSEASYFTGFVAWLTKSNTIHIGHRFTKSSEIYLQDMANAHNAVQTINGIHQEMIRQGLLQG